MRHTSFLRFLAPAIAGAALLVGALPGMLPAAQAFDWCWDDPLIQVNNTQAAINVGIEGSPSDIAAVVRSVEITVHVPDVKNAKVVSQQHQYFTETVHFVADPKGSGTVEVHFVMNPGRTPKSAGLQVTSGGRTQSVYGKTHQGLKAHFAVN